MSVPDDCDLPSFNSRSRLSTLHEVVSLSYYFSRSG
jgi:hypothetical protein